MIVQGCMNQCMEIATETALGSVEQPGSTSWSRTRKSGLDQGVTQVCPVLLLRPVPSSNCQSQSRTEQEIIAERGQARAQTGEGTTGALYAAEITFCQLPDQVFEEKQCTVQYRLSRGIWLWSGTSQPCPNRLVPLQRSPNGLGQPKFRFPVSGSVGGLEDRSARSLEDALTERDAHTGLEEQAEIGQTIDLETIWRKRGAGQDHGHPVFGAHQIHRLTKNGSDGKGLWLTEKKGGEWLSNEPERRSSAGCRSGEKFPLGAQTESSHSTDFWGTMRARAEGWA